MNIGNINNWSQSVLPGKPFENTSAEELKQLTREYPYFNAAHLLLALKMKENNNSEEAHTQLEKFSLYIHDQWLVEKLFNSRDQPQEKTITPAAPVEITREEPASAVVQEPEEPVLAIPAEELVTVEPVSLTNSPETPVKDELAFEPYHTVDYFASQGIRFKPEEKPQDRFGQQLKSFTEWLKTLKQKPGSDPSPVENNISDQKVEQLAEVSITDREVLTEAMAEVWLKQGNTEQAADIYRKLSLLNPSKSSYFASLIEKLKTS